MAKRIAVIPVRGRDILQPNGQILKVGQKSVLAYTIEAALSSQRTSSRE